MNYGKAIRIARAVRGVSQQELAREMGVQASYISMIEQGKRNNPNLSRVSHALRLPPSLLALLGAEEKDLKYISPHEANALGVALLRAITESPPDNEPRNEGD